MRAKKRGRILNMALRLGTVFAFGVMLCAALAAAFTLPAAAGKSAPAGCTLEKDRPKGTDTSFVLKTAAWRVSGAYGWRTDPIDGGEEFHRGVDLACAEGTPVLAAMDGVVVAARRSQSYGNCLRVAHDGGWETLYAHLQYLYVRTGEVVHAGQVIGAAGQTGRATGAHLHFELKRRSTNCDPSALLGL